MSIGDFLGQAGSTPASPFLLAAGDRHEWHPCVAAHRIYRSAAMPPRWRCLLHAFHRTDAPDPASRTVKILVGAAAPRDCFGSSPWSDGRDRARAPLPPAHGDTAGLPARPSPVPVWIVATLAQRGRQTQALRLRPRLSPEHRGASSRHDRPGKNHWLFPCRTRPSFRRNGPTISPVSCGPQSRLGSVHGNERPNINLVEANMTHSAALAIGMKRVASVGGILRFAILSIIAVPTAADVPTQHDRGFGTKFLRCAPPADLLM